MQLKNRSRVQTLANFVNATGGVQITPHRAHACAHFSRCVSHFGQFIQCTCIGLRCLSDSVCPSKNHPIRAPCHSWVFLSSLFFPPVLPSSATPPTPLTGIRLNPCATPLWAGSSAIWPIRLQTHVPDMQATDHQTRAVGDPEADTSCGRPRVKSGNRFTRVASTIHGKINREIVKFDRRLSQLTWTYTASTPSFRASSSKTYFE